MSPGGAAKAVGDLRPTNVGKWSKNVSPRAGHMVQFLLAALWVGRQWILFRNSGNAGKSKHAEHAAPFAFGVWLICEKLKVWQTAECGARHCQSQTTPMSFLGSLVFPLTYRLLFS